ncbi:MAG TPA: glucose 1-dehydrogenase [Paracoccaceae bacterium]|nr:glucose 1-dehydrogenase [Paracoccaceae bacterium]
MAGRVEGKVALVTGAGSGIGRASAQALAREGAAVIATDVTQPEVEATAEAIRAAGGKARALRHDAASEADWQAVLASIREEEGRLDVLVNNAGVSGGRTPFFETTLELWRQVQGVNVEGVFLGTKLGAMMMAEAGGGSVINVSSIYGIVGAAGSVSYCASKGAVRLMTKAAAAEMARDRTRVRVNSVHPGFIDTGMTSPFLTQDAFREAVTAKIPTGEVGRPEDIAAAVLFLASDESRYMTGAEVVVDAGWTAV